MATFFEYKNKKVKVKTLDQVPDTTGDEIKYIERGVIIELPLWQARILEKNKKAEIIDDWSVNALKMEKLAWTEKQDPKLQTLVDDFYLRVKEYIEDLSLQIKDHPSPDLISMRESSLKSLNELLFHRVYKVLRVVVKKNGASLKKIMTNEEKKLFDEFLKVYNKWIEEFTPDGKDIPK